MSFEAFISAILGGCLVYVLLRKKQSPEQWRAEQNNEQINAKLRVGGFIDKRDFVEKARAEVRRAPGVSTEWLFRWKKAHKFQNALATYARRLDSFPGGAYDRAMKGLRQVSRADKWALEWVGLPDTSDGLDILLGRFFDDYALVYASNETGLVVADFINMALSTVESLTDDIAENLLEEGVRQDDIESLEAEAREKAVMAFKAEYPKAFRD